VCPKLGYYSKTIKTFSLHEINVNWKKTIQVFTKATQMYHICTKVTKTEKVRVKGHEGALDDTLCLKQG